MAIKRFDGNTSLRDSDNALTLLVGSMLRRSIQQATVTILTSATKIPTTPLANRLGLTIINISSNIVYIGNSSVTSTDGFPLYPRSILELFIEDNIDVYGIAGSSSEVRILEGA